MHGQRLTLGAVYGPNSDDPEFYTDLFHRIELIGNTTVIMGGDWNIPQDYDMDTCNYRNQNNKYAQETLHKLMMNFDLIDVWREMNPNINRYTWRGPNRKQARLDYFLISVDLELFIEHSNIAIAY